MALQDPHPRCAVVVVSYGSADLLVANLLRVSRENPSLSVYVVDNPTTEAERGRVRALCTEHGWAGLYPETNLGFGEGSNRGVERALDDGAQQVMLLNPDAYVDAGSLSLLQEAVTRDPLCLAAPRVLSAAGDVWSAGVDLLLDTGRMRGWARRDDGRAPARSLPWVSGACLLLSADLWRRVGGFDPDYFLYWEDVDLSARVQQRGGSVRVVPEAVALHDEGATHRTSGASAAKSPVYYYYNVRNRMVFATKHLDAADVRRWRQSSLGEARQVLLRGGRRQLLRPHLCLWPVARGLIDGARWPRGASQDAPADRRRTSSTTDMTAEG